MRRFKPSDMRMICTPPAGAEADWRSRAEDSLAFLRANAGADEIVIYAAGPAVLIHGVLALTDKVTPPDGSDLSNAMIDAGDCWKIQKSYGGGEGHRVYLEPAFGSSSCRSLLGGEPLIFRRRFEGVEQGPSSIEISQKLVHSLDLYLVPERNAYCRLDSRGDIEEVIRIVKLDLPESWEGREAVTILRKDLDTYMALAGMSLIVKFDFTRIVYDGFGGWDDTQQFDREEADLFYHGGGNGTASYVNGAMVVRPAVTVGDLVEEFRNEDNPHTRQYATFKIYDRKNKKNVETSCSPAHLSNYFEQSDLPWEISPAFFRPDVLHRFKADPEKFDLEDRNISCRGGWYLKGYDINDEGQVHVYIGDLAHLPIEEQLYWQLYNEWPKGEISARAHQTDILGEWSTNYEPLNALKHKISILDKEPPEWWNPRGDIVSSAVRMPATDSPKEWADEIMALDQLLVEGFLGKPLRKLAEAGGRKPEKEWGPLRLMQEVLIATGMKETEAKAVVGPMQKLHALRTEIRGHATTDKKKRAEKEARAVHGSFRAHFSSVATECDKALDQFLNALGVDLKT